MRRGHVLHYLEGLCLTHCHLARPCQLERRDKQVLFTRIPTENANARAPKLILKFLNVAPPLEFRIKEGRGNACQYQTM